MDFVKILEVLLPLLIPILCPQATFEDVLAGALDPNNPCRQLVVNKRAKQMARDEGKRLRWKQFRSQAEAELQAELAKPDFEAKLRLACVESGVTNA
jgi:hypothetical protein